MKQRKMSRYADTNIGRKIKASIIQSEMGDPVLCAMGILYSSNYSDEASERLAIHILDELKEELGFDYDKEEVHNFTIPKELKGIVRRGDKLIPHLQVVK